MTDALTLHVARPPPRPRPWLAVAVGAIEARGHGEAAPLPPFSRDDVDACARALASVAGRLGATDDAAPPGEAVAAVLQRLGSDLDAVPSARFALETALLDRIGQQRGLPADAILRSGVAPAYDRVPLNALLMAEPVETLAERAALLAARGFSAVKIKLRAAGVDGDAGFARELAALHEVRARLPPPFEIRLDPNGAWSLDDARRRLEALAPIAPRFVEQPVAAALLHRLGACAVPWAADESLADLALVEPLLSSRGCAAFVLKPAILGGLGRARALALRAQERGLDVVVTHLFDGPYSIAAACGLALSLPRPPLACGLAPHADLPAFAAWSGDVVVPQLEHPGELRASDLPGLGVRSQWVCEGHG